MSVFSYVDNFEQHKSVESHLIFGSEIVEPVVSIIIPTYRRSELLKQAIYSALQQTFSLDFEIIIVDNEIDFQGSSSTEDVISSFSDYRIRYYRHEKNIGMFGNWNRGVLLSKGKWVIILHDDDYLLPNVLKNLFNIVSRNPSIFAIKGRQKFFIGDSEIQNSINNYRTKSFSWCRKIRKYEPLFKNVLSAPSGLFLQRDKLIEMGGFSSQYFPAADYLFTLSFISRFNIYFYNQTCSIYRIADNESMKIDTQIKTVEQNYRFREEYIKQNFRNSKFLNILNKQVALNDFKTLKNKYYLVEPDFLLNIKQKFFARIILRIWLRILNHIYLKNN